MYFSFRGMLFAHTLTIAVIAAGMATSTVGEVSPAGMRVPLTSKSANGTDFFVVSKRLPANRPLLFSGSGWPRVQYFQWICGLLSSVRCAMMRLSVRAGT